MATRMIDVFIQQGRLGEWITSACLMGFAAILWMPGNSLTVKDGWPGFYMLGWSEIAVAVPLAVIATLRMLALVINGAWKRSPHLRVAGSVAGAVCFMVLTFTTISPAFAGRADSINPTAALYATLLIADLFAAYRAGADAGANSRDIPGRHETTWGHDRHGPGGNVASGEGVEADAGRSRIAAEDGPYPIFASRRSGARAENGAAVGAG